MDPTSRLMTDADGAYVAWNAEFNMEFSFEVALSGLERVLPPRLAPVEVLPDRGIVGLGYLRFPEGNPVGAPVQELALAIQVHPDMRERRMARAAYFVANIAADREPFLDWAEQVDHMPTWRGGRVRFDADVARARVSVADEHGPICTLASDQPSPTYAAGSACFQTFTLRDGVCRSCLVTWSGERTEAQRRSPESRLHPHPFFRGIDVATARPHHQVVSRWGTPVEQRFYTAHPVG